MERRKGKGRQKSLLTIDRPENICCKSSMRRADMHPRCRKFWREYMRDYMQTRAVLMLAVRKCPVCAQPLDPKDERLCVECKVVKALSTHAKRQERS